MAAGATRASPIACGTPARTRRHQLPGASESSDDGSRETASSPASDEGAVRVIAVFPCVPYAHSHVMNPSYDVRVPRVHACALCGRRPLT